MIKVPLDGRTVIERCVCSAGNTSNHMCVYTLLCVYVQPHISK